MNERRERIYWVGEDQLLTMLGGWRNCSVLALPTVPELPDDATVTRCSYDWQRRAFGLCVQSASFDVVEPGLPPPYATGCLSVAYETLDLGELRRLAEVGRRAECGEEVERRPEHQVCCAKPSHRGLYVQTEPTVHYALNMHGMPICGNDGAGALVTSRQTMFFESRHQCSGCAKALTRDGKPWRAPQSPRVVERIAAARVAAMDQAAEPECHCPDPSAHASDCEWKKWKEQRA